MGPSAGRRRDARARRGETPGGQAPPPGRSCKHRSARTRTGGTGALRKGRRRPSRLPAPPPRAARRRSRTTDRPNERRTHPYTIAPKFGIPIGLSHKHRREAPERAAVIMGFHRAGHHRTWAGPRAPAEIRCCRRRRGRDSGEAGERAEISALWILALGLCSGFAFWKELSNTRQIRPEAAVRSVTSFWNSRGNRNGGGNGGPPGAALIVTEVEADRGHQRGGSNDRGRPRSLVSPAGGQAFFSSRQAIQSSSPGMPKPGPSTPDSVI